MRILIDDIRPRFGMLHKKRNCPFTTAARVGFIFLVVFGFVTAGFSRERGPRVEVVTGKPLPQQELTVGDQNCGLHQIK